MLDLQLLTVASDYFVTLKQGTGELRRRSFGPSRLSNTHYISQAVPQSMTEVQFRFISGNRKKGFRKVAVLALKLGMVA